ncbi:MAG: hypothetical protein JXN59_13385, partial [Anaerolineae bacterium]|nr:hypothetical protein [Anaerolineae bacterium]
AERLTAKLYGAWLYYRGSQIMVAIGTKAPGETETHVDHAQPPGQGDCILQLPYDSVHHEHLSQQITSVLLNDGPLS